ncbi:hypothetical protein ACIOHS_26980 [Streptomyces sp. NPDC088253]
MIYLLQLTGLGGLYYAVRGRPRDLAAIGGLTALAALVISLVFWDAW